MTGNRLCCNVRSRIAITQTDFPAFFGKPKSGRRLSPILLQSDRPNQSLTPSSSLRLRAVAACLMPCCGLALLRPAKSAEMARQHLTISDAGQSAQTLPPAETVSGSGHCRWMWPPRFRAGLFCVVWNSQVVKYRHLLPRRIIGTTAHHSLSIADRTHHENTRRWFSDERHRPFCGKTSY